MVGRPRAFGGEYSAIVVATGHPSPEGGSRGAGAGGVKYVFGRWGHFRIPRFILSIVTIHRGSVCPARARRAPFVSSILAQAPTFILTQGSPPSRLRRTPWSCITRSRDQGVRFTHVRPSAVAKARIIATPTSYDKAATAGEPKWARLFGEGGQKQARVGKGNARPSPPPHTSGVKSAFQPTTSNRRLWVPK